MGRVLGNAIALQRKFLTTQVAIMYKHDNEAD